jgi:hypothetical protein
MKIDYDGASGTVELDENGDVVNPCFAVWQLQGGKITILSPSVTP